VSPLIEFTTRAKLIYPVLKEDFQEVAAAEHRRISNMVEVMILKRHEQKSFPPAGPSGNQNRRIRIPSGSKKGAIE